MDAYAYLWWGGDVLARVRQSLTLTVPYGIAALYLDCEDNGNGGPGVPNAAQFPPSRLVGQIQDGIHACQDAGLPDALYSGAWWWKPATGDDQTFAGATWWAADYDGRPDPTVFEPFAGIEKLTGKQYTGDAGEFGITCDLSVFAA